MRGTLNEHVNIVAERIHEMRDTMPRLLVAITGAPASGKSTLAEEVSRRLTQQRVENVVVPMDGFHLDNTILEAKGSLPRKGAPHTFDADGYVHMIRRIKDQQTVFAPTFDRSRDISIAGTQEVPADCPVVITEGNYLMYDDAPWRDLADLWDLSVRVEVPMPELRARLIQRWLSLNHSRTNAVRRAEGNDIPNAKLVDDRKLPCNITVKSVIA